MTTLKEKLKKRATVFGSWTSLAHPEITEIFASIMKPDFHGIDIEHSTIRLDQSQRIIAAGQAYGVPVLPRTASHNGEEIRRLCDSGAEGIIVPMVNSKEELENILECFKYPPLGKRRYGVARAQGYGSNYDAYARKWNEESVLIVQIESMEGVEAVDEIISHEQVDGVMIGPYDISGSFGIPGKLEDPKVLNACDRVIQACARHHKSCGTQIVYPDEANVQNALDRGYTFVILSSDLFLMWKWSEQMRHLIERLR